MTEAEWLTCNEPAAMVRMLGSNFDERKWRLLCCGFCRVAWGLMNEASRHAVCVAERFADGEVGDEERAAALAVAALAFDASGVSEYIGFDARQAAAAAEGAAMPDPAWVPWPWCEGDAPQWRCDLIRDVFRNPFRTVAFSPSWHTDTALSLAHSMYKSRDFSAMPILADALQDSGCDSDDVLNHCRGPGPHVRGCWVLDLVMGKE